MKKKNRQKKKGFDELFDAGKAAIDFSGAVMTRGLGENPSGPEVVNISTS